MNINFIINLIYIYIYIYINIYKYPHNYRQSDTDTLKTRPSAVVGVAAGGGTTLSVESGNDSSVGATSGGNSALVKESVVQPIRQQLEVSKYYNFKYIFRVALVLIVLIQIG